MALTGFPDFFRVRTGSAWNGGQYGPDQMFDLYKVDGQDFWTTSGEELPNGPDSMKFQPLSQGGKAIVKLWCSTNQSSWIPPTTVTTGISITDTAADYAFKQLFTKGTALTTGHNHLDNLSAYVSNTSSFNPSIFDIMEEGVQGDIEGMDSGKLIVTLGSAFVGGGFGLNENDKLILKRFPNPSTNAYNRDAPYLWSEDGTDVASATNRIMFRPSQFFRKGGYTGATSTFNEIGMTLGLLSESGTDWVSEMVKDYRSARATTVVNHPYNALDLWTANAPAWVTGSDYDYSDETIGASWGFTSLMRYNPNVFKTMEFIGQDKTTYHYG